MQKIIILCLVVVLLLAGCTAQLSPAPDDQTPSAPDEQAPSEITSAQRFGYTEADLVSVILTDIRKEISVNMSANSVLKAGLMDVKYDSNDKRLDAGEAVYELKINGKSLYIYPENIASYDGSDAYACLGFNTLAYLDGVFAGELTQPSGFADDATIRVQNARGLVAQVQDTTDFLAELGRTKIIQVASATDYAVPSTEYIIAIGEDYIKICGDYLKIGEDLYAVVDAEFSFLNEYTFSSSSDGFLPWI